MIAEVPLVVKTLGIAFIGTLISTADAMESANEVGMWQVLKIVVILGQLFFYFGGGYALLSAYYDKNKNWKMWVKRGCKPEEKDEYGIK